MYHLFVISDGSGRSGKQMLNAALTQFPDTEQVRIHVRSNILSEAQVLAVLQEAVQHQGVIFHTIVTNDLRTLLIRESQLQNISTVDLMGPILHRLAEHFSNPPSEEPGLFHQINEAYFHRIDSMEFAFHHDDGQRIDELNEAEIILVGVSRTFKTPLSIYLALKGWFVANVPLVLGIQPPEELFDVDPHKVIALTAYPRGLAELRKIRASHLKHATGAYARLDHVKQETQYANRIFEQHPEWKKVRVTGKPIEEIASEIIKYFANTSQTSE